MHFAEVLILSGRQGHRRHHCDKHNPNFVHAHEPSSFGESAGHSKGKFRNYQGLP
jgi:hypothetical protein